MPAPSAPSDPLKGAAYLDFATTDGSPASGKVVTAKLVHAGAYTGPFLLNNLVGIARQQTATSDSSGRATLELYGNDQIDPAGSLWLITEDESRVSKLISLDAGEVVDVGAEVAATIPAGSPATPSGVFVLTTGSYSNPSWLTALAWSKITGTPTTLAGYGITDGGSSLTLGTGVETALGVNVGSAGAFVVLGGAGGTPSSLTLTNATGLPVATGISGLGTGVETFLGTPSSANLAAALTDETGSAGGGKAVFSIAPTIEAPIFDGTARFNNSSGAGQADFRDSTNTFRSRYSAPTLTANRAVTAPDADTKLPISSQQITWNGPTAPRAYALPDADAEIAVQLCDFLAADWTLTDGEYAAAPSGVAVTAGTYYLRMKCIMSWVNGDSGGAIMTTNVTNSLGGPTVSDSSMVIAVADSIYGAGDNLSVRIGTLDSYEDSTSTSPEFIRFISLEGWVTFSSTGTLKWGAGYTLSGSDVVKMLKGASIELTRF